MEPEDLKEIILLAKADAIEQLLIECPFPYWVHGEIKKWARSKGLDIK